MLMKLLCFLHGYVQIQVIGSSPERFLNLCRHHKITVWNIAPKGNSYTLYLSISGFRSLKPILRKTQTRVIVLRRFGLPFFLFSNRRRKMFFLGFFCSLLVVYLFSLFLWDIQITGNYVQTDEVLLEFLASTDVTRGMPKSEVDCAKIVRMIRTSFPDIIWVSASLEGTRLQIAVKENETARSSPDRASQEEQEGRDLVASKDGTITKIIPRAGTPLVHEGDTVTAGDILVLGRVDLYNDAKEVTGYHYMTADADIQIRTTQAYEESIPLTTIQKNYTDRRGVLVSFVTQSHCLTFGTMPKNNSSVECHTQTWPLSFGKGLSLPCSIQLTIGKEYQATKKTYTKTEYQTLLSRKFATYCQDLEKKGVQILENDVKIYKERDRAAAKGTLVLSESAYVQKDTQIQEPIQEPTNEQEERN